MNRQRFNARVAVIMQEIDSTILKGPPTSTDQAGMELAIQKLSGLLPLMAKVESSASFALGAFGEDTLRKIFRIRTSFYHQMNKDGMINGYLSLQVPEIEEMEHSIRRYLNALMIRVQQQAGGQGQAKNQPQQPQPPPPHQVQQVQPAIQDLPKPAPAKPARPASIAQNRKNSTNKVPSAPIATEPPFAIGAASSPHGVPVYDGKMATGLTPDKLQLPPRKKQRTAPGQTSTGSTPANPGTTPTSSSPQTILGKTTSPESKRQQRPKVEPQAPKEPDKRFRCKEETCERFVQGFEKEEDLKKHAEESHQKIEDSLQFFLDSAATYFDVNKQDDSKAPKMSQSAANRGKAAVPVSKSHSLGLVTMKKEALKVEGHTPGRIKHEVTTPAPGGAGSPASLMKPPTSYPAGRTPQNKQQPQTSPATIEAPKKSMREILAGKHDIDLAEKSAPASSPKRPASFLDSDDAPLFDIEGLDLLHDTAEFSFAGLEPVTPSTGDESGFNGSDTTSASSFDSTIHENDRLKIAFEWQPGGPDDLENMAADRSGIEMDFGFALDNASTKQDMDTKMADTDETTNDVGDNKGDTGKRQLLRPELTWESVFGMDVDQRDPWDFGAIEYDDFGNI